MIKPRNCTISINTIVQTKDNIISQSNYQHETNSSINFADLSKKSNGLIVGK
jgi:hypothetical protein